MCILQPFIADYFGFRRVGRCSFFIICCSLVDERKTMVVGRYSFPVLSVLLYQKTIFTTRSYSL